MNKKIDWVSLAKGIGIILVVIAHEMRSINYLIPTEKKGLFLFFDNYIYSFVMPLFFFLSGLFFFDSLHVGLSRFISKKLHTIFYPYVVWSLIQSGLQGLLKDYVNNQVNFWQVLWQLPYKPYTKGL